MNRTPERTENRPSKKRKGHPFLKVLKYFFITCLILFLLGCIFLAILFVRVAKDVPAAIEPQPALTSTLINTDGDVFARLHAGENRDPARLDEIPQNMLYATISIEDERFYKHFGIDIKGIMRAVFVDIVTMSKKEGASTITQQLAKNAFLNQDKTFDRKIKEIVLAIQLERHYSKDQILEFYLNQIYYGNGASGIKRAAHVYFNKNLNDLTLSECALLAGIPKAPTYYSPYQNMDAAIARRNLVLDKMAELGYITPSQAEEAKAEKVKLADNSAPINFAKNSAPYFVDYVVTQLEGMGYDSQQIYSGGMKIYTTLDSKMQNAAEDSVSSSVHSGSLKGFTDKNGIVQPQIAVISVETDNGYIKAMVGGRDYQQTKFNRAVQAYRQPGSAFKPFVYTTALDNGFTPASVIEDKQRDYAGWKPKNDTPNYRGPVTLAYALQQSINTVAVETMNQVGADRVLDKAETMGISSLVRSGAVNDRQLATALGGLTKGVSPIDMASAYAVMANAGTYTKPTGIIKIEDRNGNVLFENTSETRQVISPQTAYLITSMLRNVVTGGTGGRANIGRPVAGKTGTTSDYTDAWFVGFTPDISTAVWIGADEAQKGKSYMRSHKISSSFAAGLWGKYMKQAVAGTQPRNFPKPANIVGPISISKFTGMLAGEGYGSSDSMGLYFLSGTVPTGVSSKPTPSPGAIDTPTDVIVNPDGTVSTPGDGASSGNAQGNSNTGNTKPNSPTTPSENDKYVYCLICLDSGQLAGPNCPNTELKRFKVGTQPTQNCQLHP